MSDDEKRPRLSAVPGVTETRITEAFAAPLSAAMRRPELAETPDYAARIAAQSALADRLTNDYDARLLRMARTAAACQHVDDMRGWLRAQDDPAADDPADRTVYAVFLGRLQAVTGEMCRWVERERAELARARAELAEVREGMTGDE